MLCLHGGYSHLDLFLDVIVEQDVWVDTVVGDRECKGVKSPSFSALLLSFLISPFLALQKHTLKRGHDTWLCRWERQSKGTVRKAQSRISTNGALEVTIVTRDSLNDREMTLVLHGRLVSNTSTKHN